jgi:hypothetical protein
MLRLALLCHLSVAVEGAGRIAENVKCLIDEPDEVYLSFTGSSVLHNNLGGQGNPNGVNSASSVVSGCENKTQDDVCSKALVIGNVFNPADSSSMTRTQGVKIDLYIEMTTPGAPYVPAAMNNVLEDEDGTPTFGAISLKGPDAGGTRSVALTFTFKRRDTGDEVQIPFMQFTLFDFDHNPGDGTRGQECAIASGFEDYAVSSGPGVISPRDDGVLVESKVQLRGTSPIGGTSPIAGINYDSDSGINEGQWCSMDGGTGGDNPSDPLNLTDVQMQRSVSFFFKDFSTFDVEFTDFH